MLALNHKLYYSRQRYCPVFPLSDASFERISYLHDFKYSAKYYRIYLYIKVHQINISLAAKTSYLAGLQVCCFYIQLDVVCVASLC